MHAPRERFICGRGRTAETLGGLTDHREQGLLVCEVDKTRTVARQLRLSASSDLPEAHRRREGVCAMDSPRPAGSGGGWTFSLHGRTPFGWVHTAFRSSCGWRSPFHASLSHAVNIPGPGSSGLAAPSTVLQASVCADCLPEVVGVGELDLDEAGWSARMLIATRASHQQVHLAAWSADPPLPIPRLPRVERSHQRLT